MVPVLTVALSLAVGMIAASCGRSDREVVSKEDLRELNRVISQSEVYSRAKMTRLDSLRKSLNIHEKSNPKLAWKDAMKISATYNTVNSDSSLAYALRCIEIGRKIGDERKVTRGRIAEVSALSVGGFFAAAESRLDSLLRMDMAPVDKLELWRVGRQLYSYMRSYSDGNITYYSYYNDKSKAFDDSLIMNLPSDDKFARFILSERMVSEGHLDSSARMLDQLMKSLDESDNIYAMAAYQLAEVWRQKRDYQKMAKYLVAASIADIKGGVKEGWALPALAKLLYSEQRFEEARHYVNFSIDNAASGNTRMRYSSLATMVPEIDKSYNKMIRMSQRALIVSLVVVFVLLVISASLVIALRSRIRRVRANEAKLSQTSRLQDAYIGNFLGLCSTYADRLDSLGKLVIRKLKAGQADDLLKVVSSGRYLDEDNDHFYKTIDTSFLDLYPDFIEYVNSLLREDSKIEVKETGALTPELRIYAFVKLGVTESARIAQILHYSSNTVYAYRCRMRKRAINPDTFDQDILMSSRKTE